MSSDWLVEPKLYCMSGIWWDTLTKLYNTSIQKADHLISAVCHVTCALPLTIPRHVIVVCSCSSMHCTPHTLYLYITCHWTTRVQYMCCMSMCVYMYVYIYDHTPCTCTLHVIEQLVYIYGIHVCLCVLTVSHCVVCFEDSISVGKLHWGLCQCFSYGLQGISWSWAHEAVM